MVSYWIGCVDWSTADLLEVAAKQPKEGVGSMKRTTAALLVPLTALVTAVLMVIAFVVFIMGVLAWLAAIAVAVTAYMKREDWTLPAYRWTKDRTGRWRVTPWTSDGTSEVSADQTSA